LGEWNWQKFYNELKYIVSVGITMVGATIIMNQELTKGVDDKLLLLPPKVSFLINFELQAMRFFAP